MGPWLLCRGNWFSQNVIPKSASFDDIRRSIKNRDCLPSLITVNIIVGLTLSGVRLPKCIAVGEAVEDMKHMCSLSSSCTPRDSKVNTSAKGRFPCHLCHLFIGKYYVACRFCYDWVGPPLVVQVSLPGMKI